jgi:ankyrin repeat protein
MITHAVLAKGRNGSLAFLREAVPSFWGAISWKRTTFRAKIFISHNWSEKFADFVTTASNIVALDEWLWICAFAIDQNLPVGETLGASLEQTPFARALAAADRVVVFLDESALTLTRVWCVLESHLALRDGKDWAISLPDNADTTVWDRVAVQLEKIDVRSCKASVEKDRLDILAYIEGAEDVINQAVQNAGLAACTNSYTLNAARQGNIAYLRHAPEPLCADAALSSTLHEAASAGVNDAVVCLLCMQADPDGRSAKGEAPLHRAASSERADAVLPLMEARADVHARDGSGEGLVPLHIAARLGRNRSVELLLAHRAHVNFALDTGETALHLAADAGHQSVTRSLLRWRAELRVSGGVVDKGFEPTAWSWKCGTPLHFAARAGCAPVLALLLSHRAHIEAQLHGGISRGATPLASACFGGHVETAELLLQARADMAAHFSSGLFRGMQPLCSAATQGHAAVAQLLLQARADVAAQLTSGIFRGEQPLIATAMQGHVAVGQLLLQARADVAAQFTAWALRGCTPLHRAAEQGHVATALMLLEARADVAARANHFALGLGGCQPLHSASGEWHARYGEAWER